MWGDMGGAKGDRSAPGSAGSAGSAPLRVESASRVLILFRSWWGSKGRVATVETGSAPGAGANEPQAFYGASPWGPFPGPWPSVWFGDTVHGFWGMDPETWTRDAVPEIDLEVGGCPTRVPTVLERP